MRQENIVGITENKHLQWAYREYMAAVHKKRNGYIGNIEYEREQLRRMYRIIAGK